MMTKIAERFMQLHKRDIRVEAEQSITDFKQMKNDEKVRRAITKIVITLIILNFSTALVLFGLDYHRPQAHSAQGQFGSIRESKYAQKREFQELLHY
jgi:hypothetical protein